MHYRSAFAALALAVSAPAFAQTEPPKDLTLSGSVGLTTDYRFRGVSQSDREGAIQGGFTITHKSGFYVGTWGSNLSGWGTFGGSNMELDLVGGFKAPLGEGASIDVGLTWYMYPGGASETDFAEPYVKLSGTAGPATLTAGVAYAPKQQALGNWFNTPQSRLGDKEDNLYLWGDAAIAFPDTPLTLKGHIGYSDGNPGLGPNGTSVAPTGKYWDWLAGVDFALAPLVDLPLTLSVAYVDTDISRSEALYIQPNFSKGQDGSGRIDSGRIVFSLTAAF